MQARQTVPEALYARCVAKANEIAQDCLTGRNGTHRASHGIGANLSRLVEAKVGEVAMAQALGLDPCTALHWDGPDPGFDMVWHGLRIDVKATYPAGEYLLWPINKNDLFERAPFDILALVKVHDHAGWVAGWRGKWRFHADRLPDGQHPLTSGTWCVHQSTLLPFEVLEAML